MSANGLKRIFKTSQVMSSKNYLAFRKSLKFAIGGLICLALIPIGCTIVDDGVEGWDDLDNKINVITYAVVACLIMFSISFIIGVRTIRKRKIALLWLAPIGFILLVTFTFILLLMLDWY